MARPRKNLKRDRQFNVGLTARARPASGARRGVSECVRWTMAARGCLAEWRIAARLAAKAPHLDPLFIAQLSRLGNNLNQIARRLKHSTAAGPAELAPLLEQIRHSSPGGRPMIPRLFAAGKSFKGVVRYLTHDPDKAKTSERV